MHKLLLTPPEKQKFIKKKLINFRKEAKNRENLENTSMIGRNTNN
jgi:hypothetical protein